MKDMNPFGEPLPENRAALEVKEDGQIWLNDGRQSILVSDQEVAKTILLKAHRIEIDLDPIEFTVGIYPIPDLKWEVKEVLDYVASNVTPFGSVSVNKKVAVISLPESDKEPRKKLLIEMMQEDEKNGMYKSESPLIGERSADEILERVMCKESRGDSVAYYIEQGAILEAMEIYASQFKAKEDSLPEPTDEELLKKLKDKADFFDGYNALPYHVLLQENITMKKKLIELSESKEDNKAFGEQDMMECWQASREHVFYLNDPAQTKYYPNFKEWLKSYTRKPE